MIFFMFVELLYSEVRVSSSDLYFCRCRLALNYITADHTLNHHVKPTWIGESRVYDLKLRYFKYLPTSTPTV
jgi:hypothetical protein